MIQFFKDLISSTNESSSKRFAALFTLANIIILTYLAAWVNNWITPEFMFNGLCIIAGGGLGLTVVENIFKKQQAKTVSSTATTSSTGTTVNVDIDNT